MEIQHHGAGELSSELGPLWPEAKQILSDKLLGDRLSPQQYGAWIEPLFVVRAGTASVQIVSPNEFFHRYVTYHYRKEIESALREGASREGVESLQVKFTFTASRPAPRVPSDLIREGFPVRDFDDLEPFGGGKPRDLLEG
ncbi:MAG: hypothetical protein LBQ12_07355, partial [Deltaproteobacteria bacterium]|nr:hypothetical protein [Deltaproteobacteria bacterium]